MDKAAAKHFNALHGKRIQEIIGNFIIEIEPMSCCIFDRSAPSNGQHYHNYYEMCVITDGSGEFFHGGETYPLAEGDVFIANPGVVHEIRLSRDEKGNFVKNLTLVFFNIYIQASHKKPAMNYEEEMIMSFLAEHLIVRKSCKHILSYLNFFKSYMEYLPGGNYSILNAIKGMALDSLFSLVDKKNKQFGMKLPEADSIVESALQYITANFSNKIYIGDIAAHSHTSVRNLQHLFKKHLNKTVSDYICDYRLSIAAGYLKMNFKVSDVGPLVGISDPGQFSRLFKNFYGISPKKFQMIHSPSVGLSG